MEMVKEHVSFQVASARRGIIAPVAFIGLLSTNSLRMLHFPCSLRDHCLLILKQALVYQRVSSHIPCTGRLILAQGAIKASLDCIIVWQRVSFQVPCIGRCIMAQGAIKTFLHHCAVAFHVPPHSLCSGAPEIAGVAFVCFLILLTAWFTGWRVTLFGLCVLVRSHVHFNMAQVGWSIIALVAFYAFVCSDGLLTPTAKQLIWLHNSWMTSALQCFCHTDI